MDLPKEFPYTFDIDLVDHVFNIIHYQKLSDKDSIFKALPINKQLKDHDLEAIIIFLLEEKYIYRYDSKLYALTVKGHLFWESGSYRQKEKQAKWNYRKDIVYTFCVAVGTALAGLYALYEIFLSIFAHTQCS